MIDACDVHVFMCEFAQDLFYRLVSRDLHFRGFLTKGEFEHQQPSNLQAFYCTTYCRLPTRKAHRQHRAVHRRAYCPTATSSITRYDKDTYFIHLMQSLEPTRFPDVTYPLDPILIEPTGGHWPLAYDFRYLKNILPT